MHILYIVTHTNEYLSLYLSLLQDSLRLGLLGRHHRTLLGITAILELVGLTQRSQSPQWK